MPYWNFEYTKAVIRTLQKQVCYFSKVFCYYNSAWLSFTTQIDVKGFMQWELIWINFTCLPQNVLQTLDSHMNDSHATVVTKYFAKKTILFLQCKCGRWYWPRSCNWGDPSVMYRLLIANVLWPETANTWSNQTKWVSNNYI